MDGSPPGPPVPEILQARTLEWVAISFSNAWNWKVKVKSLSRVRLRDPMDCSLTGSSVRGIFQARIKSYISKSLDFPWRLKKFCLVIGKGPTYVLLGCHLQSFLIWKLDDFLRPWLWPSDQHSCGIPLTSHKESKGNTTLENTFKVEATMAPWASSEKLGVTWAYCNFLGVILWLENFPFLSVCF